LVVETIRDLHGLCMPLSVFQYLVPYDVLLQIFPMELLQASNQLAIANMDTCI
jgi:hypothetical protein